MSLTPPFSRFGLVPPAQGLYDPAAEKDACGLAMVATLRGTAGHDIITAALDALRHLEHRGAVGSDAGTGDGAGIVTQVPDEFLREVASFPLPAAGSYAVGNAFLRVHNRSDLRPYHRFGIQIFHRILSAQLLRSISLPHRGQADAFMLAQDMCYLMADDKGKLRIVGLIALEEAGG